MNRRHSTDPLGLVKPAGPWTGGSVKKWDRDSRRRFGTPFHPPGREAFTARNFLTWPTTPWGCRACRAAGPCPPSGPRIASAIWSDSLERCHRLANRIQAGVIWINCWLLRDLRTPFGGMKQSGLGREGGFEALRFFTEPKNVCVYFGG